MRCISNMRGISGIYRIRWKIIVGLILTTIAVIPVEADLQCKDPSCYGSLSLYSPEDMRPGQSLNSGQSIQSNSHSNADIWYELIFDGEKLVLREHQYPDEFFRRMGIYDPHSDIWDSGTTGKSANVVTMQTDGNLVIKDTAGNIIWESDTHVPGSYLEIQNEGYFAIYRPNGQEIWTSLGQAAKGDRILPGEVLNLDESITSQNGLYKFIFNYDENLLLKSIGPDIAETNIWDSETIGKPAQVLVMQTDGNLVLYDSNMNPLWSSNTHDPGSYLVVRDYGAIEIWSSDTLIWRSDGLQPGQELLPDQFISSRSGARKFTLQEDGNLVLYDNFDNTPIWDSGTAGKSAQVLIMQTDGNLVLYDQNEKPINYKGTRGSSSPVHDNYFDWSPVPGSHLVVKDEDSCATITADNAIGLKQCIKGLVGIYSGHKPLWWVPNWPTDHSGWVMDD